VLERLGGRERVIGVLAAAVVIGVGVWIVTETAFYLAIFGFGGDGGFRSDSWMGWAQILSRIAYDVWLGALALLLLLWLVTRLAGAPSLTNERNGHRDTDLPSD
jgi:hypothetical protein